MWVNPRAGVRGSSLENVPQLSANSAIASSGIS